MDAVWQMTASYVTRENLYIFCLITLYSYVSAFLFQDKTIQQSYRWIEKKDFKINE